MTCMHWINKHLSNIQQILEEVGSNATDVVISPDGSWKVITESDENVEAVAEATHHHGDPSSSQNLRPDVVLDLTRDENEMETSGSTQIPSASTETLLPQSLNVYDGQQQQFMNFPVSAAGDVIHMPFFPTSSPQDTYTGSSHISMPAAAAAHSSQYQGLHVSSLGVSLGRDSGLMERWNHHNYAMQVCHL